MSNLLKMMAGAGIAAPLYSDDVFSAYTYTGNGSTQTITNGIDLAGEGGMVWVKSRSDGTGHWLSDSARASGALLNTNTTGAEQTGWAQSPIYALNSDGFSVSATAGAATNANGATHASWTFRNSPNFFGHQVVVKSSGSSQTALFPELTTLGMVRVKRTDAAGSWYIWHRSLTAGKLLIGETTAAEATLGHITVSGTTVTLVNGVIADGTYLVEAWAHDTSSEGIVQCGAFTTDGSGNATVTLGFEPQYLLAKRNVAGSDWQLVDSARGFPAAPGVPRELAANTSAAETNSFNYCPTASGFTLTAIGPSQTVFYLAIRRPNKPPTVGTQVYNAIARTGTGAAATVTGVGFAPDLVISRNRQNTYGNQTDAWDRLRGTSPYLQTQSTTLEGAEANAITAYGMDGITVGADLTRGNINYASAPFINHFFRRAPGFFDEVCYTGDGVTGRQVTHNLGVAPELMIVKCRTNVDKWPVYHPSAGNMHTLRLNTTDIPATDSGAWNNTSPTSTYFVVGPNSYVNFDSSRTYVAYLFATLAGISCVTSFTGDGTANPGKTINCGFSAGSRFVLIKRTDSTGDWYIWDTVRGISASTDPHLSLNTTAAEVTGDDTIDPTNSGFVVNQNATTNCNVNGATYIVLSIA